MQSTWDQNAEFSSTIYDPAAANEKYIFAEIYEWVEEFTGGDNVKKAEIIQQLLRYMTKFPELYIKLYEETPLRNSLVDAQRTSLPPELKENVDRTLVLLEAHRSNIVFGAASFLDKIRPILLKPQYQSHTPKTQVVKMTHPGKIIVPFDPVFTARGAPVRPITMETTLGKVVQRDLLQPQTTVEGAVFYCDIVSFNDLMGLGILDADIPVVGSSRFIAGKNKGGITFDSSGSIWINGEYDDAPTPEDKWTRGVHIAMEADLESNPRTLRFFVGGRQIQRYVTNIPARIRFFATTILDGDWFQVVSLCLQDNPIGKLRPDDIPLVAEDNLFDYSNGL